MGSGVSILPTTTNSGSLGSSSKYWDVVWTNEISSPDTNLYINNGTASHVIFDVTGNKDIRPNINNTGKLGNSSYMWDQVWTNELNSTDNDIHIGNANSTRLICYTGIRRSAHSSGFLEGSYNNVGSNSAKSNPIYTIGSSYNPTDTAISNMYGIGYSHGNFWGSGDGKPTGWAPYSVANGTFQAILGDESGYVWARVGMKANNYIITESGAKWYNINSSYIGSSDWIQSSGNHFLYAPNSGYGSSHFYPANNGSHGAWRIIGNTGGYGGFHDHYSSVSVGMHDSSGNGGTYRIANGRWHTFHRVSDNCLCVGDSTTSSSYGLYVAGAIYSTGDIVAYSDARIKTNVKLIDSPLDKVMAMRGVYYNRIDEGESTSRKAVGERCVGMIAQELNEVLPEAVTYAKDIDRYGIDYGKVTSVLIEAIKELKNEVNELRSKYGVN
jgi:hypothetical protein